MNRRLSQTASWHSAKVHIYAVYARTPSPEMAFVSPTAVLLSLVALVFSGQYWAAEGTRGELPSQACVPLTRLSVRPVFAGDIFRSPHVGYAIEDGFNPAMQEQEYDRRDNEFHEMKLDLIVGDHQCFSSLPNMATFCTFSYFYTPCIKMTVVPLNNGEETSFSLVPPCRSLCEAALEELARYPGECLEEACPNVRNITIPISTLLETYSNCSNYPIRGICVPRRSLAMSCDPIPCDHAARRLIPSHFQTGYPTQNNLVTAPTHLHSFEEANQEFEGLGLDRLVLDATCQTKLLSTLSFLTFAYFPVCTAYPDQNVRLTLPCRGYCVKAREELSRYNSRDELILDCPAVRYMPRSMSLDFVLSLPIFECSRYYVDKLCVPYSRPAPPINCPFNKPCDKCDKCRTSFKDNPGDLRGKTFGTVTANRSRKYEYGKPLLSL